MRCLKNVLHRRWFYSFRGLLLIASLAIFAWIWLVHGSNVLRRNKGSSVISLVGLSSQYNNDVSTSNILNSSEHTLVNDVDEKTFVRRKAVLIFAELSDVTKRSNLVTTLESYRIGYDIIEWNEYLKASLPEVIDYSKRQIKYAVFIFESLYAYTETSISIQKILFQYCQRFNIGLLIFSNGYNLISNDFIKVKHLPLKIQYGVHNLRYLTVNKSNSVIHTIKNDIHLNINTLCNRTVFQPLNQSYQVIAYYHSSLLSNHQKYPAVIYDNGHLDFAPKIIFDLEAISDDWTFDLIFYDSLIKLSNGILGYTMVRNILVDIDDVFVPRDVQRPTIQDIEDLLRSQRSLAKKVPGFHYNLGFSGKVFKPEKYPSDDVIVKHADQFWWFCHTHRHKRPHTLTLKELQQELTLNKKFAEVHNLNIDMSYSVAPYHSGVYPVYEALYEAWTKVLSVKVTSTEEYPHLNPPRKRRGFMFKGIKVLPRQVCGIFTHTLNFTNFQGGKRELDKSICGGSIFKTIMHNPISIFMTHYGNYGNDRLGSYVFENVIEFIQKWTNIKLMTRPPLELAKKYFDLFPLDIEPVWQNPCSTKRHHDIWPVNKPCTGLPKFVIVGPQKTGTTALHSFLSMHPSLQMNLPSKNSYEEVQFFSGSNYLKGLDWYMSYFPVNERGPNKMFFEKSATYFDFPEAPRRIQALLPDAKLIVIIIDPVKRAYSWYQHQQSKPGSIAHQISFFDLINGDESTLSHEFMGLQDRCIYPGLYAKNLERWLQYFKPEQIMIVDGDALRTSPPEVLDRVQYFINVDRFDYNEQLKYDKRKGFYCPVIDGKSHCLGTSKGRKYPTMDPQAAAILKQFYMTPNFHLAQLFMKLKKQMPLWLKKQMDKYSSHTKQRRFDRLP